MFCPPCGVEGQAETYCRQCGTWLPDLSPASQRRGPFRKMTRDERILKMRILGLIGGGLSIGTAAIIFSFLFTGANRQLLFLAAFASLIVAAYQAVNFYLGYRVFKRPTVSDEAATEQNHIAGKPPPVLSRANDEAFTAPGSVTEGTTQRLDPVRRENK